MARYFFHVHDRLGILEDDEGIEFTTLDEAKEEAQRSARDLMAESKKFGTLGLDRVIEVQTANGDTVYSLWFKDALRPDDGPPPDSH